FGTPVEVYRSDNDEVWYYRNNESFEFNVLSTFFTARDYRLKRDIKYEDSWYDQLATLRSGIYE
ncbi:MAG: GWxTD domain-containing protein, partial [Bacteroidota bacterium]